LSGELFNIIAGVKTQHIPYKGAGPAMIDLIGGHVQMFYSVPVNILTHVQGGKLKAIAVTGKTRLTALPQMPTFAEAGLPGFDIKTWNGVLAPAATPKAIVDKLSAEISAMLTAPGNKEKLDNLGMTTMVSTPEQFGAMIKTDMATYLKVIKAANIRVD
jgi:tripartite-type tricarboxylate transporter receptor subunit TctC